VQPNLSSSLSVFVVRFTAVGSTGYTLTSTGGAELTLTSTGTGTSSAISDQSTSGVNIISAPLVLGGNSSSTQSANIANLTAITGAISSTNADVTFAKSNAGTLFLLGANTYTGQTVFAGGGNTAGTIVINSIGDVSGGASSLGAPTTAANGTIRMLESSSANNGALRYIGGVASTDRNIDYQRAVEGHANSFTLDASGSGALTWEGNYTTSGIGGATVGGNFWLNGVSGANNTFSGAIGDNTSSASLTTEVVKNGTGKWVLSGANTFTGGLNINGGTLVLDYATNPTVVNSANTLYFGYPGATAGLSAASSGGTLQLIGKSSGSTAQTLGNSTFGFGQNRIAIDPNGGAGTTLTLGSTWTRNFAQGLVYLDLPTNATLTSNPALTNSLVGAASTAGYVVIRDSAALGFATVSGGNLTRYTGATPLANNSNSGINYKLSTGLTFLAGAHAMQTLDIDTTAANGSTLDLNTTTATANALLTTGTGNFTISNGVLGAATNGLAFHQYSTGTLSVTATVGSGTLVVSKGGFGTLALDGKGSTGALNIFDGAVRANGATVVSSGNVVLSTGGVLELGSYGNLTAGLGTTAGTIQFAGDGGFSAFGAERTVQIGGNTNTIAWGATNFVPNASALVLSGRDSDNTIDFQNGLNLGSQQRVVRVQNGSHAVDGKLSGTLSGSYGGGLIKEGAGALSATGNNTYLGETWVTAGTLLVNNTAGSGTGSGAVTVSAGGTLGGNGTISGAVSVQGSLAPGNSIGMLNTGSLSITSTGALDIELGRSGITPVSDRANVTGTVDIASGADLKLTLYTGLTNPLVNDIFFLISNNGTDAITGVFTKLNGATIPLTEGSEFTWNSQQWEITYTANFEGSSFTGGNDLALQVVPEPTTWVLLALSATTLVLFRRRAGFSRKM